WHVTVNWARLKQHCDTVSPSRHKSNHGATWPRYTAVKGRLNWKPKRGIRVNCNLPLGAPVRFRIRPPMPWWPGLIHAHLRPRMTQVSPALPREKPPTQLPPVVLPQPKPPPKLPNLLPNQFGRSLSRSAILLRG